VGGDVFKISVETEGLDGVFQLLAELNALIGDYGITGAELKSVGRQDGHGESNADIAGWLSDDGRNFFDATPEDTGRIAKTVAAVVEMRSRDLARRLVTRERKLLKGLVSGIAARVTSVSDVKTAWAAATGAAALRAGMREWMRGVDQRLTDQEVSSGAFNGKLSERYAAYKAKRFGFVSPIGVASGQLRDNFGASIASGGIRILTNRSLLGDLKARLKKATR
jgi:hypothetical protein